ncbi:penicillin-binding transpeptidase domain-containing protein [Oceanidesulfovibrio indonesiensis]|nr:penicillin-binding transpeptidase domain-containing protein [Oceanidesulfovibrio indonesiensis]
MANGRRTTPRREKAEKTRPGKVRNGYRSKPFSARLPFSADRESPAAVRSARPRIIIVAVCFALLWGALWLRALHVQVVDGPELAAKARKQHLTSLTATGPRGNIFDRTGRAMAKSVELYSVFARPLEMADREATADALAPILDRTPGQVRRLLAGRSGFVWLDRKVSDRVAAAIRAARLDGVYLTTEYGRQYPNKYLAGQLLGFVGLDEQGLSGLELAYDKHLAGKNIRLQVQRDAKGNVLRFDHSVDDVASIRGGDITLTIDAHVQLMAQEELAKAVTESGGKQGGCLVVDLENNDILAWAQYPFFNPNDYERYGQAVWRNSLAIDALEMGSTMKPFLMAAALQEGVIERDTLFFCENGRFKIGRNSIRDTHEYGWLPAHKVLRYSSNIGSAKIGMTMGKKTYHGYLDRLGFGRKTGLGLPGESPGILRPPGAWREIDLVTASFGQGFSATLPQLARAFSCLANQGVLRPLSLVKNPEPKAEDAVRIFSPEVAQEVLAMMSEVVEEDGTGTRARIAGMQVGGKTGTAQKASPNGGYGKEYVATFLGLLPIEKPRYLIVVLVDEPQKSHYGGVVAAPAFREIAVKTLAYKGGLPDMPVACENGAARQPSPACKPEELAIAKAKAAVPATEGMAPDVVGLPLRKAIELFASRGTMPVVKGEGEVVARQEPAAGRAWKEASEPTLWLEAAKGKG